MYRLVKGAGSPHKGTFCVMSAACHKHLGVSEGLRVTDGLALRVSDIVRELVIMLNDSDLFIDVDHRTAKLQPLIDLVVGSYRGEDIELKRRNYLLSRLTPESMNIGAAYWSLANSIREAGPEFIDYLYNLILDVINIGKEEGMNNLVPFQGISIGIVGYN